MKKLILTAIILGAITMSAEARTIFTKPYRCIATAEGIAKFDPFAPMPGRTYFPEVGFPLNHEDDTIEGMEDYVDANGIIWTDPEPEM